MSKNSKLLTVFLGVIIVTGFVFGSCASVSSKQWGLQGNDTIGINLAATNIGNLYITDINGEATGAKPPVNVIMGLGSKGVYVNPIYVKLTDRPINFRIVCPVEDRLGSGKITISWKSTELRFTQVSDVKPGDVLTIRWMYQTQTFAFIDATGNIVQQTIPTFEQTAIY